VLEKARALSAHVSGLPGFIEGSLYASANDRSVLIMVRFESVSARQRALEQGEVETALRDLRALAHPQMNVYELVETFDPPAKKR
jgi:heme-degrading monooxygenase HmoA